MTNVRAAAALAAVLTGAALLLGGPVANGATAPAPAALAGPTSGGDGGGGSAQLPATWPKRLPVPAGTIQGSSSGPGRWVVSILADGSVAQVRRSTVRLYTSHGFRLSTDPRRPDTLISPAFTIVLAFSARDHSASRTYVVLQVTKN